MNSTATVVLLLLIIVGALAFVRLTGGVGGPVGRGQRERIVEREVPRRPEGRVVEREVVERPATQPDASSPPRVVEREVIREEPDVL
jgi:hypothetical protein